MQRLTNIAIFLTDQTRPNREEYQAWLEHLGISEAGIANVFEAPH